MVSIFLPGATQIWLSSLFMPNVQTTLLVFGLGQSGREYWWQGFSSSVSPHSLPPFLAGVSTLRDLVFLPAFLFWCWRQQLDHSDHSDITQSTARAFKIKMADCVEQADKAREWWKWDQGLTISLAIFAHTDLQPLIAFFLIAMSSPLDSAYKVFDSFRDAHANGLWSILLFVIDILYMCLYIYSILIIDNKIIWLGPGHLAILKLLLPHLLHIVITVFCVCAVKFDSLAWSGQSGQSGIYL